jgi:hypothetical protein
VSTWPIRAPPAIFGRPSHSVAIRNNVIPSQRAGETAAVKVDRLQHLTTFANAHATFVRNVSVPDGVIIIAADAIGDAAVKSRPHAPVRQTPVRGDVESRAPLAIGFRDDQHGIVGRHGHTIRESDVVGHLSSQAIRGDESNDSRSERLTGQKVEEMNSWFDPHLKV